LDVVTTAHYLDGFHEFDFNGNKHYVKETWFFDVQASYDFGFIPAAADGSVAGYSKANPSVGSAKHASLLRSALLNGTTLTIGCNNVFGHDPPRAATTTNYADFAYDATGRFVYVSLRKKL